MPVVNFNNSVSQVIPLYSLNVQTVANNGSNAPDLASYVGQINLVGSVTTYSSQTYRSGLMTAKAETQPGTVTFSVYDPRASINYLLPVQTTGPNAGQLNLQNPNGVDALIFNGRTNLSNGQNPNALLGWGVPPVYNNALGYVPPVFMPPTLLSGDVGPFASTQGALSAPMTPAPGPFPTPAPGPITRSLSVDTAALASLIQNSNNSIFLSPLNQTGNVNVVMAPDANALANSRTIAGMQAFGKDALIPKPESGMVNVLVKVMINGEPTTLAASSPIQGFKFTVPAALLPESIVNTRGDSAQDPRQGVVERAVQSDGSPLPIWLIYDAETNTFSAKEIPVGAKPVEIKIQTVKDGQLLEESPPIVIDTK
jgi:hypothetical protein